jgi:prevent-host-death family protein
MASTGIRELRPRASELLRRVEAGETIEITDRGRSVAVLAPLPDQRPIDRLRATYVDSSALVKLAVREVESAALRRYLGRHPPLVVDG